MSRKSVFKAMQKQSSLGLALGLALMTSQINCIPVREEPDAASVQDDGGTTGQDAASQDSSATGDATTHTDAGERSDSASSAQDAARRDAGPGGITIYDLRDPSSPNHPDEGSEVSVSDVVVTGIDARPNTTGFWVQETSGGAFSGIFVFEYSDSDVLPLGNLHIGDVVSLTGTYAEFHGMSQININSGSGQVTGTHAPLAATRPEAYASDKEPWEGVLIRLDGPCSVSSDPNQYGQVTTSCSILDDDIWAYGDALHSGMTLDYIVGLQVFSFDEYKVLPRDAVDLGLSAGADAGTAYDSGSSTGCGNVTYQGECHGNSITYCYDGELVTENCVTEYGDQATCGLLDCEGGDCLGYYCIATPGGPCTEIDCDLQHGCINGVCADSTSCDDSYDDVCVADSTRLSYCHPFSGLINEMDCALDVYGEPADYICGETSDHRDACLGTVGEWNCDLTQTPAEECAPGLVCSSETMMGNCEDPNATTDGGVVDATQGTDAAVGDAQVQDSASSVEDAGVEDAGVEDASVEDAASEDI